MVEIVHQTLRQGVQRRTSTGGKHKTTLVGENGGAMRRRWSMTILLVAMGSILGRFCCCCCGGHDARQDRLGRVCDVDNSIGTAAITGIGKINLCFHAKHTATGRTALLSPSFHNSVAVAGVVFGGWW